MTTPTTRSDADHDQVSEITTRMRDEAEAVRQAFGRLCADQDEAWKRYSAEVQSTLTQMQHDLEEARARLAEQRAQTRAEMREDLEKLLDKMRARYDDLRIQLHLGELEGEDLLSTVRADAGELLDRGRDAVRAAGQALADAFKQPQQ